MSNSAATTTRYQDQLTAECRSRNWRDPAWQVYSDRRGGRTAWSAAVTVEGRSIAARLWYDGQYINSAKEEAAQIAVQAIRTYGGDGQAQQHQGEQHRQAEQQAVGGSSARW